MSGKALGMMVGMTSWLAPAVAAAAEDSSGRGLVGNGISGVWVLCNVSYAGMRAQDHPSRGWRAAAFIFGFPGTLITYFFVTDGSNQAYGVVLPPRPPGR